MNGPQQESRRPSPSDRPPFRILSEAEIKAALTGVLVSAAKRRAG